MSNVSDDQPNNNNGAERPAAPVRPVVAAEARGVELEKIPALAPLLGQARWCCWTWTWRPKKNGQAHEGTWTKVPWFAAKKGPGAPLAVNRPEHGRVYDLARDMVLRGDADGVGWIVTGDLKRVWFDFDKCRDPVTGNLAAWAGSQLARPDVTEAYTEVSPSGTGIHVTGKAPVWDEPRQGRVDIPRLLAGLKDDEIERWGGSRLCHPKAAIEIYHACVRYVCVTGWSVRVLDVGA